MRRALIALAVLLTLPCTHALIAQTNGYYRQPSIRGDKIVFVSEGDLWLVGANGGAAQRLTTNTWQESQPAISPDGQTIAFTGRYDGVPDVYTIPLTGGTPVRHSWDANALVVGWTDDGKILYTTNRYSTLPNYQLVSVDPKSNTRDVVKLAQAWDGAFDGNFLFFTRTSPQSSNTKRYKGGTAQQIWKFQGKGEGEGEGEAVCLTCDFAGTSRSAHVYAHRIYFLSDRDNVMNIWSMDENGKDLKQVTFHKDYDVRDFSMDAGRIAYQQGADLFVVPVEGARAMAKASADATSPSPSPSPSPLKISIATDLDQMRDRWIKNPVQYLSDWHIDKTGDRIALIARGMVFVAPATQGRFVALRNNGAVRYRDMRFAPDGKTLYTLNDKSGEVELWATPANGVGDGTQLTKDASILRWDMEVSPDGKYIVHDDKNQRLWLYDVAAKTNKQIAESKYDGFSYYWTPDSKSVLYVTSGANQIQRIYTYDVATGNTTTLTSDRYDSFSPTVTPDGQWLYFLSDRTFNTTVQAPWGARQPEPYYNKQTKIYAIQLKPGAHFPFASKSELDADSSKIVISQSRNFVSSLYEVPTDVGNYFRLRTDGKRLYYYTRDDRYGFGGGFTLLSLEFKNEDIKPDTFAKDVRSYELSGDNKKILLRKNDDFFVVPAGAKAPTDMSKSKVDLSGWMLQLERREEMPELFKDAWRLERDYFYDPGMHGQDWKAMYAKYEPLAKRAADRNELNDVIAQMVGELSALHIFVYGGDIRPGMDTIPHASLGAVLEPSQGGWKVAHIYKTDADVPGELSPLAAPGVNVSEGDVITAIDGVPLSSVAHPAELLYGKAGKQVLLEFAGGKKAIVYPITLQRENSLRYSEWEYTRRLLVDKMSGGKIGYVHLRAMGPGNMNEFQREYYPQFNKDALIVDMRHNSGGNIDSWVLEKLMRKPWFYWQPRVGEPSWNMQYAFRGPMATIINEWSASDGEAFPEGFRRLGLGKLVGTRTWGGEVWLSSSNRLADQGIATAAETGVFGPEGQWLIEGHGVDPDVVVDNNPASTFAGSDAQIEATVKMLLDDIARKPNPVPKAPVYPKK